MPRNAPPGNVVPFRQRRVPSSFGPPRGLPPWLWRTVVGWLVVANVAVWLATVIASRGAGILSNVPSATTIRFGSLVPPLVLDEPWRLITSTFLHGNLLHVAMNLFGLHWLGTRLEGAFGRARFLLLYLGAGAAGAVVSAAWHALVGGSSVGASGAVLGLLGALVSLTAAATGWRSPTTVTWRNTAIGIVAVGLLAGAVHSGPAIDNAGHLGGLIGGFALARLFAGRPAWRGTLERAVLAGGGLLVAGCFLLALTRGASLQEAVAASIPESVTAAQRALVEEDWPAAEAALAEAIRRNPNPTLRLLRAQALDRLERRDEAREELLAAARVADDPALLEALAVELEAHQEAEAARKASIQARLRRGFR